MRILILVILLSGCGMTQFQAKVQTRNDMLSSKDIYKTCLAAGGECINEKRAYDADLEAFSATSDAMREEGIRIRSD